MQNRCSYNNTPQPPHQQNVIPALITLFLITITSLPLERQYGHLGDVSRHSHNHHFTPPHHHHVTPLERQYGHLGDVSRHPHNHHFTPPHHHAIPA